MWMLEEHASVSLSNSTDDEWASSCWWTKPLEQLDELYTSQAQAGYRVGVTSDAPFAKGEAT